MTTLPSPPLNALSPEPSYALHHYAYHPIDPAMKALLASSLRVMDQVSPSATTGAHTSSLLTLLNKQPPPPTLREILEAYKARGDGDREMLLAMLNAKSSEDQVSPPVTYATRAPPYHSSPAAARLTCDTAPHTNGRLPGPTPASSSARACNA